MGNSPTYFVYGRVRDTDRYTPELVTFSDTTKREAMAFFKHVVFSFALQKKHSDCRCLYLYGGSWRIAKAHLADKTFTLEFRTLSDKVLWFEADEKLPPTYWPLCGRTFHQQWNKKDPPEVTQLAFTRR